jgi:hypothetical protein
MVNQRTISKVLRTLDRTSIFKLAKDCGVDVTNKSAVKSFIDQNAPTQKVEAASYRIAYQKENKEYCYKPNPLKVNEAIKHAHYHRRNTIGTNYFKILIIGKNNIYWASPVYGHSDYNKARAFSNTEKNRRAAYLINQLLKK